MNTKIDMTGIWFISFGIHNKIEGSYIVTIEGNFDKSKIIAYITDAVVSGLNDNAKETVKKYGPLVIRSMTRLSPLKEEGSAK